MPIKFNDIRHKIANIIATGTVSFGLTQHEVCIGGAGGLLSQVPALGSAGQVLTSNGAGADPSWQAGGTVADPDVWLSGLMYPSGLGFTAVQETIPRVLCSFAQSLTSGTPRIQAIALPAGKSIGHMAAIVGSTAELGGTHGWYALLDNTFKVIAVTADQVGAAVWSPINTPIPLAFTAPALTAYRGIYYAVVCVTATTMPNLAAYAAGTNASAVTPAPALSGLGALQNTPPALGATVAITGIADVGIWAAAG